MPEKKYAVRLLFDVPGWAYHRRCKALETYAPPDFHVTIGGNYGAEFKQRRYDLCLQLVYPCAENVRKHIEANNYGTLVVTGLNVAWSEVGGWWKGARKNSDWIVFNSRMAWEAAGRPERTSYISNGIDRAVFRVQVPPAERKFRVLSIGSTFHAANKGAKNILPEVARALRQKGIKTDFRTVDSHSGTREKVNGPGAWEPVYRQPKRLTQEGMAAWYNTGTVYLVASKKEGTPNPALEAASCGCVLVATPVGNMPELIEDGVNGYLVERNTQAIVDAVVKARSRYAEMHAAMEGSIRPWHWKIRGQEYFELFRELIEEKRSGVQRMWGTKEENATPAAV